MDGSTATRVKILGIDIDRVSLDRAVGLVTGWLREKPGKQHYIVTTNPEFIMAAQKDSQFQRILNGSNLAVADGVALRLSGKVTDIVGGIYLMERLCRMAAEEGFTTAFLGGRKNVAKEAAKCLQKKYPGLKVVFAEDGPEVDKEGCEVLSSKDGEQNAHNALDLIPNADLLFVGFGQVKQEKWIATNLPDLRVRVAMGVGGSFDELAGRTVRVPRWIHILGLKWLIRLLVQPWRIRRQLVLARFVWLIMRDRF